MKSENVDTAKIFYLHFILDMTFNEISKELEMNESAIKSSLYRMLKKIKREYLGGEKVEK